MNFDQRLELLQQPEINALLLSTLRGLEREALRVNASNGKLAQTAHPAAIGSALTHPQITTDYSEALLEFITDPQPSIPAVMRQLEDTVVYVVQRLGDEVLWANSMPCQLGPDSEIPLAQYGSSHTGRMKTLYREGLGLRYGRAMQCIAGIHFNFSLPDSLWARLRDQDLSPLTLQDYKTRGYMSLIRNFRRQFWLLLYLMGAAPAICKSFVRDRPHKLSPCADGHSLCALLGTSLRMGNLGYQSSAQDAIVVCYNELGSYIGELCKAILTPAYAYEALGLRDAEGRCQQLNTGLLQIENEFYSTIRPKQTTRRGETQLRALAERGVEYIEVRCLDLNPFADLGIDPEQLYFVEAFLLACLLEESPQTTTEEYRDMQANQAAVVYRGRDPQLQLKRFGRSVSLSDWAAQIMRRVGLAAEQLDRAMDTQEYSRSVASMQQRLLDSSLTPSARLLASLEREQLSYQRWMMARSLDISQRLRERTLDAETSALLNRLTRRSLEDQRQLEAAQTGSFDDYLAAYYQQYLKLGRR